MTPSEVLTLIFLYNAAKAGGEYFGPKFIEGIGQVIRALGHRAADMFKAGRLPRDDDDQMNTLEDLKRCVSSPDKLTLFPGQDEALLKRRVVGCLAKYFTAPEMRDPLKVESLLVGHVAGLVSNPMVVAVELYELARMENKVHWLVDAMIRYPGREEPILKCLLQK
jgi:hypothetical protein